MTLTFPDTTRIPRFVLSVLLLSLVAALGSGCGGDGGDGLSSAATKLGLKDAPTLPPEVIDVLCDASIDTPCTEATLAQTLESVLTYAASRPNSHVRLWRVGRDVSDTFLLAEQVALPPPKQKKAMREARRKWVDSSLRFFLKAAEPMLQGKRATRSALFESLTKVALAEVPGITTRVVVFLTDGLEVSGYADFEASELAPVGDLSSRLHADRVLAPGVLKDTKVYLAFTDMSRAVRNRGRSSIPRLTAITGNWRQILREAGSSEVVITTGVAPIGERLGE